MSLLAEFEVPAEEFVLVDTLTAAPGMRIEIKRVVGGEETVTPYFWAAGGDFERFEAALRADEMVQEVLTLEEQDVWTESEDREERFYRVTWKTAAPTLIRAVSEVKAAVLEAKSDDGERWDVKVLFPNEAALSAFDDYCRAHDCDIDPVRVYRSENPEGRGTYDVTEEQQDALEAAYHAGYFAVPRDATMTEVAEELDISRNALSARLRRGHRNLLANTLVHEEGSDV